MQSESVSPCCRTKWKRQTAVGIELLQEASNVAALQQMYRTMGLSWPGAGAGPGGVALPPHPPVFSSLDLYYRHAAAAHSLQRPVFPAAPAPALGLPPRVASSPALPLHLPHSPLAPLSLPTASTILQEMSADALKEPFIND